MDTTERKRSEEALREAQAELARVAGDDDGRTDSFHRP
jgi:hypothetical protein